MELSVPYQRQNISIFYNKIFPIWLEKYLSQLMRFWYLLHMQAAKPPLHAKIKLGGRWWLWQKSRPVTPIDS